LMESNPFNFCTTLQFPTFGQPSNSTKQPRSVPLRFQTTATPQPIEPQVGYYVEDTKVAQPPQNNSSTSGIISFGQQEPLEQLIIPDSIFADEEKLLLHLSSNFRSLTISQKDIKVIGPIGRGFFGEVYNGIWKGREVAIKKIVRQTFRQKSDLELFYKEIDIWSKLKHQCIVSFLAVCLNHNERYMITEFMPGGNLSQFIQKKNHLITTQTRLSFVNCIAHGMEYLHDWKPNPIIHRDLSSMNVLLDSNFTICKISDFGLSRFKNPTGNMTAAVGSLAWMAPEIWKAEQYNEKADVYSFAIIIWELWALTDPYQSMPPEIFASMAALQNKRPSLRRYNIPPKWTYLIANSWHPSPNKRPSFKQIIPYLKTV